jgi:hypothetical protein
LDAHAGMAAANHVPREGNFQVVGDVSLVWSAGLWAGPEFASTKQTIDWEPRRRRLGWAVSLDLVVHSTHFMHPSLIVHPLVDGHPSPVYGLGHKELSLSGTMGGRPDVDLIEGWSVFGSRQADGALDSRTASQRSSHDRTHLQSEPKSPLSVVCANRYRMAVVLYVVSDVDDDKERKKAAE